MLTILEKKDDIAYVQSLFVKKLAKTADKQGKILVGYQGGSQPCDASWSKELGMWWINMPVSNRFWNGFGTENLRWGSTYAHILDCEINPPFKGINRRISGAFAVDENGGLFLLHRGRIGGGRKGIGKNLFVDNYSGNWVTVNDGDTSSRLALVASFENPRFVVQVANFVNDVKRMKLKASTVKMSYLSVSRPLPVFKEEFSGSKKIDKSNNPTVAECDHGLIVNELAKKFEHDGVNIGNSQQIDLFTVGSSGNPKTLFEVKTDATTTKIFEAIGQLYYYSVALGSGEKCYLVAVFPKTLKNASKKILEQLNIQCLTYDWVNDKPVFTRFDSTRYT